MSRCIFSFSVFFFFILFLTSPVKSFAQTPAPASNAAGAFSSVNEDVPQNTHTWTQTIMIEASSALTCLMTGTDIIDPQQKCLGIDPKTRKIGYVDGQGGAIGQMTNLITMLYTPPLHTGDYFQHIAGNFGIVKPAYAQTTGIGFQGLSPLLPLWIAFRNIVYLLFVLIFLLVGVAIMLRLKIDPRTVMSIENQLPKIIVGLLLVTFSFAIAGFFIDMMYVTIYLIAGVLNAAAPAANINTAVAGIQGQNTFEFASGSMGGIGVLANNPAASIGNVVFSMFTGVLPQTIFAAIGAYSGFTWGTQIAQWVATTVGAGTGGAVPAVGAAAGLSTGGLIVAISATLAGVFANYTLSLFVQALVFLIVGAALLIALFRLWITLLFAYVYFLIDVIFAPFWIIAGAVPGSPVNIEMWIRDMLANLSAFPVTITMFLLGKILMTAFAGTTGSGGIFVPPLVGNPGNPQLIGDLLGLTIILMTPGVVTMMREIIKAPTFKYAAVAAQQLQAGVKPPQRLYGGAMKAAFGTHYKEVDGHTVMVAEGGPVGHLLRTFGMVSGH